MGAARAIRAETTELSVCGNDVRSTLSTSPCDRRDDADFVALLHRRVEVLEEADVFVVEVDVDEAVELVGGLEQARLDAGGAALYVVEDLAHISALGLDAVFSVGVVSERGWDSDLDRHGDSFFATIQLVSFRSRLSIRTTSSTDALSS